MRRILMAVILCLSISFACSAQQKASDAPATKEDIQKYFQVMHSREMTTKIIDAMLKPIHQMIHEDYLKDQDKLPPDFESRMNKQMDDFMTSFPFDELFQATATVYQKHFSKGDIDNFIAFYSTPSGQKLLQELPAIAAESMEVMMPIMQKHVDSMKDRIQQQVAQMIKDSKGPSNSKSQTTPN